MMFKEEKYLGIPFKMYGEDEKGIDCANLACLVARGRGHYIPNINHFEYTEATAFKGFKKQFNRQQFKEVEKQSDSIVLLKVNGIAGHVGYMLSEKYFIHVLPKRDVTIENINSLLWKNSVVGFYKFVGDKSE